jgi:hypothetical protein
VLAMLALLLAGVLCAPASLAGAASTPTIIIVPGKSIGSVYLGEPQSHVHVGRVIRNGPGSFAYPDYAIVVAYRHGSAVAIATNFLFQSKVPGEYETPSHPALRIGVAIGLVTSAYPRAQCAHHIISTVPPLEDEACLLRSRHGNTFFAGNATTQGQTVRIGAILVSIPSVGPQSPKVTG